MSGGDVNLKNRKLTDLIKAFKGDIPSVRVGIMGAKDSRTGVNGAPSATDNAAIGARWEYDPKYRRSFLRVPLIDHLNKYLEKSGAFDEETLKKVVESKSMTEWLRKVGITAELVVADAFATSGFGKWVQSRMDRKKNQQTLVETQQLRNSITSEVK